MAIGGSYCTFAGRVIWLNREIWEEKKQETEREQLFDNSSLSIVKLHGE